MRGFSLVELSIVLVILGLLTGGILAGQNLIRAAELRSINTDAQKYQVALNTFRDKYFALPGDMKNATKFWGIAAGSTGNDTTCKATSGTNTATCNGNGDGIIPISNNEIFRVWEHLSNAGLIEGNYTGILGISGQPRSAKIGVNVPRSKISNAGFMLASRDGTAGGLAHWSNGDLKLLFGAEKILSGNTIELEGKIITPEEAWNVDTKMDDGMPFQGSIKSYPYNWFGKACTASSGADSAYALSTSTVECALSFVLK